MNNTNMQKNIVIIEDDESLQEGLCLIFNNEDFCVRAVSNADNLGQLVRDFSPDLYLIDYRLPGDNGIEITQNIRAHENGNRIPIIIMSASGQSLQEEALRAGADGFIRKPFDVDDLIALVKNNLPA
jgi:DNA-binding response OmpR family regulator